MAGNVRFEGVGRAWKLVHHHHAGRRDVARIVVGSD